jgi:hypothetical protein
MYPSNGTQFRKLRGPTHLAVKMCAVSVAIRKQQSSKQDWNAQTSCMLLAEIVNHNTFNVFHTE